MAYSHDAFPFTMEHQPQANMYFHPAVQYAPYLPQQQHHLHHHHHHQQQQVHPEMIFPPVPYTDYTEFMPMGMMSEDYDESSEVSTRPRLTKEQVEVLESQFQAHPKPNSMVKKQLAVQTKLTLPRVANWFQNRRAKAKQQRKQEEFETAQSMANEGRQSTADPSSKTSSPTRRPSIYDDRSDSADPKSPVKSPEASKEASWASLQRALGAADAVRQRQQRAQEHAQAMLAMPPPELPRYMSCSTKTQRGPQYAQTSSLSPPADWCNAQRLHSIRSPSSIPVSAPVADHGFDFGFDQEISSTSRSPTTEDATPDGNQPYVVPEDWTTAFSGSAVLMPQPTDFASTGQTSPLSLPAYPESRRGSGSDELTANLGTFALAGTPPISVAPLNPMAAPIRSLEGEIDIASRRKRPRPAALTSLRSRSYGQLSSTSPGFRPAPPSGNALRHVKSTGHSLNSHYAGIRKSSLPQRSPLNLASFTEAESLKRLMAQQAAAVSSKAPLTTPSRTEVGPAPAPQDLVAQMGLAEDNKPSTMALPSEVLAQFQQVNSPPHTPFQTEYMMQAAAASMRPPSSVRSQYAGFAEYTPPYSAGPLTNSTCWSDAPLHSPDVTGFPTGPFMSSLAFATLQEHPTQQWVLPSDNTAEMGLQLGLHDDHKKTEFFITEFPGQKEEYASIAQNSLQPKPKSYTFSNTAPSDYDG